MSHVVGVEDLFPLTRELGLGVSNDESLVTTQSLNGKSRFVPPPPSDILSFDGATRFIDDLGLLDEPVDADLCDDDTVTHRYGNQMDNENK